MDYFDNFEEMVKISPKINKSITILAFKGDAHRWYGTHKYVRGSGKVVTKSFSDRKVESAKATRAYVIIYQQQTHAVTRNTVYRNTKGIYFKADQTKYYLIKEPLPDCMK
jgi:hypothetical protein